MSRRSLTRRVLFGVMLLASLAAAAPIARWCPLRWDQVDLKSYFACASLPRTVLPVACARRAECESATACSSAEAACGAKASCPMRAKLAAQSTPRATAACGAAASAPSPARPGHGRAYCLDEPGMATASRGYAPVPDLPIALAAFIVSIEPPESFRLAPSIADARPPTASHLRRPPIRGPPILLG